MNVEIVKHLCTIKKWNKISLDFNLVRWNNGPVKYDIRKWEDGSPQKGVSMNENEIRTLFFSLGEELGYFNNNSGFVIPTDMEEIDLPFPEEKEQIEEKIKTTPIDYRYFMIYGQSTECNKHDIEEIKAVVPYYSNGKMEAIVVPARYCKTCKAYYISEFRYNELIAHGKLMCKVVSKKEYENYKKELQFGELSPQSELSMVGYTTNSKDNYSDEYRRMILKCAIAENIFTKKKAIGHLSFLIKLNEGTPHMDVPVQKWKEDHKYLLGYDEKEDDPLIGIKGFIK